MITPPALAPLKRILHPASFLVGSASPSADLYLGFSCRNWIKNGIVRRLTPTVFQAGETVIVVRHSAGLSKLPAHKVLVYLVDDDFSSGVRKTGLPLDYRLKLALLEFPSARQFAARSDIIVTTSTELARLYRAKWPNKKIMQIDPAWPIDSLPEPRYAPTMGRIALLMGRSHARDAAPLWPELGCLLRRRPELSLTVSANLSVPRAIRTHSRVTVIPALSWTEYLPWLKTARFDIGMVPDFAAQDFNAARSVSKLSEYAMTGAAVIASANWTEGLKAARSGRCLCVQSTPSDFVDAVDKISREPEAVRELAACNKAALSKAEYSTHQRLVWRETLDISINRASE